MMNLSLPLFRLGRRPGSVRRWLVRLAALVGLAVAVEAGSYFAYRPVAGRAFTFSRAREDRRLLLASIPSGPAESFTDVHPYLGFSYNPDWRGYVTADNPISPWGFTDRMGQGLVRPRGPDRVVIGILGASVASIFSAQGLEVLDRELRRSPRFAGKQIDYVNLAVGGFKQPQQLMTLNYAHALGAEFDVVINLDGLNEIAWTRADNGQAPIFHLFPNGWHRWFMATVPPVGAARQVARIAYVEERRKQWAAWFERSPLRHSVAGNLVWKWYDRLLHADVDRTDDALCGRIPDVLPYRSRGPHNDFRDDDGLLATLVEDWERCSLLLDALCQAHGTRYCHFLQPNQYVPGSKPLSPLERQVAFWEQNPGRPWIERGYPLLRQAGQRLARRGVCFRDLSMAFARNVDTLYFDSCCHFNRQGNEILAVLIAQAILETSEPPVP